MAAYIVASYKITDPDAYKAYPGAAMSTLLAHGAEVLVADFETEAIENRPPHATVVVKFPSK